MLSLTLMPTVLRFSAYRVVIYPNDHRPAHVHAIRKGREAVFKLNCPSGPVEVRENYGFARYAMRRIETVLLKHLAQLCRKWEMIHGRA
jgi:hypothetical protein